MASAHIEKIKNKQLLEKAEAAEVAAAYRSTVSQSGHIIPYGDVHRVKGQNFLVMSYCTSDGSTRVRSTKNLAQKFSASFCTETEAREFAKIIRDEDPRFDVQVVDMGVWGTVPMPTEDRPFVQREYTDSILTKCVSGLQRSMVQGKREIADRKARDRAKALAAMQKSKGKDYVMPEKSAELQAMEDKIRRERLEEEEKAKVECRTSEVKFSSGELANIIMQFCCENNVESAVGSSLLKYIAEKSIELEAQVQRAKASEFEDENPKNFPTAAEVQASLDTKNVSEQQQQ
jgi:hypothetical protein